MSHPRSVTILPGGVSDLSSSQNAANLTMAISYSDTAPPSISYGMFYSANDTLAVETGRAHHAGIGVRHHNDKLHLLPH